MILGRKGIALVLQMYTFSGGIYIDPKKPCPKYGKSEGSTNGGTKVETPETKSESPKVGFLGESTICGGHWYWDTYLGNSNMFYFHPETWGKWSNLTNILFRWVETTNLLLLEKWVDSGDRQSLNAMYFGGKSNSIPTSNDINPFIRSFIGLITPYVTSSGGELTGIY